MAVFVPFHGRFRFLGNKDSTKCVRVGKVWVQHTFYFLNPPKKGHYLEYPKIFNRIFGFRKKNMYIYIIK